MKRIFSILAAVSLLLFSSGCVSSDDAELNEENTDIEYKIFTGLPKSENPISTVNCKEHYPSLLCYGDGNTYFMWDGTVYKHSGTETVPLFDKYAYNLNYYDGKLYFIENNDYDLYGMDWDGILGLLYCYDLETGGFEQITDYPIYSPIVTDDGIFWTEAEVEENRTVYKGIYRFDTVSGKTEFVCQNYAYISYSGYNLTEPWKEQQDAFFSNGNEAYSLNAPSEVRTRQCISGDYYYFYSMSDQSNRSLNRISMLTGEVLQLKPYISWNTGPNGESLTCTTCIDYTVLNDEIYFIDDAEALRKYNEATDSYSPYTSKYSLRYLYSDEESLYGVVYIEYPNVQSFVKITPNKKLAEMEILA